MLLRLLFIVVCTLTVLLVIHNPVFALEKTSDTPRAVTTVDPDIPAEDLALLLHPFTKEELMVEAEAGRPW